ncbi:hypothetical protein PPL_12311 [Heterostelium album PN500]|uniref:B box-type domain-containing protein n=1 Tax=Heterostelium pallidum (strain ATCC 26659 / Pp 5 / PN500) TaxID=670386 RepID=D3BMA1_HETP5|nr:hypothetical protein PPL_12311 [Heterostelium album PN500]EFA77702.1 hypothetical protein PPL_12311 [Heterostelium album PN500]|eukprot:XP_020429830.1 hypothetical protein PPL_12311 [Heterostelium album PN500]
MKLSQINCTVHTDEPFILFCKKCNTLVCSECMCSTHQQHTTISIKTHLQERKESIDTTTKKLAVFDNLKWFAEQHAHVTENESKSLLIFDELTKLINNYKFKYETNIKRQKNLLEDYAKVQYSYLEQLNQVSLSATTNEVNSETAKVSIGDIHTLSKSLQQNIEISKFVLDIRNSAMLEELLVATAIKGYKPSISLTIEQMLAIVESIDPSSPPFSKAYDVNCETTVDVSSDYISQFSNLLKESVKLKSDNFISPHSSSTSILSEVLAPDRIAAKPLTKLYCVQANKIVGSGAGNPRSIAVIDLEVNKINMEWAFFSRSKAYSSAPILLNNKFYTLGGDIMEKSTFEVYNINTKSSTIHNLGKVVGSNLACDSDGQRHIYITNSDRGKYEEFIRDSYDDLDSSYHTGHKVISGTEADLTIERLDVVTGEFKVVGNLKEKSGLIYTHLIYSAKYNSLIIFNNKKIHKLDLSKSSLGYQNVSVEIGSTLAIYESAKLSLVYDGDDKIYFNSIGDRNFCVLNISDNSLTALPQHSEAIRALAYDKYTNQIIIAISYRQPHKLGYYNCNTNKVEVSNRQLEIPSNIFFHSLIVAEK